MNYKPVSIKNKANKSADPKEANNSAVTQVIDDQGVNTEEIDLHDKHFVVLIWSAYSTTVKSLGDKFEKNEKPVSQVEQIFQEELEKLKRQEKEANNALRKEATHDSLDANTNNTNLLNDVSAPDIFASPSEGIFTNSSYDDEGLVTDFNNLETTINVSLTPTTRIHTIHPKIQILRDHVSAVQTRSKIEPKKISQALEDESWVDAIQEELLNKKDERGVVVRNKARLVAQGHKQEEGIDYDEVFTLVALIKAIRIFLAFPSYMGFIVYQIDVKSAFLYGSIDEEVYVTQPPGFLDPKFPNKVYKVVKALYELHQAPRAWYAALSRFLKKSGYSRGVINKTLFIKQDKKDIMLVQVKQKEYGIFISQDKYVAEILKKFDFLSVKTASTPIETQKLLVKDDEAADVDVYLYRSMIGSLMYLTASKPDIMFAVRACSRFQNQLLDYGFNLMNTKIYIDNESRICIVKNPVFHFKTKHIEIRHHFIRDAYENKLIQLLKLHTDDNVADLLMKAFDVSSKELASTKQTALGKDESNSLIIESLLKIIWSSMHHVIAMKHCLFQSKQLLGAYGCILGVNTPRCNKDSLELKELMVFSVPIYVENDGVRVNQNPLRVKDLNKYLIFQWKLDQICTHSKSYHPHILYQAVLSMKKVKTVDDAMRVEALIDAKRVTFKESSIRRILKLDDEEGISCLANDEIFTALWHQQSSALPQTRSLTSQAKIEKLEDRVQKLEEEKRILKEESFKQGRMIANMDVDVKEEPAEVEEVLEVVTAAKRITNLVTTAAPTTTAAQVPKARAPRRRRGVIIQDPEETTTSLIMHIE
nr:hypothetical protein [Tanacetum cinerariifolium]